MDDSPADRSDFAPPDVSAVTTADIVRQWRQARPDLDLTGFLVGVQLGRVGQLSQKLAEATAARFGLGAGEMMALTALRRQTPGHALRPTDLYRLLGVSSGTMTYRLDKLAGRGLVERAPDPQDGRGVVVRLTADGVALADQIVEFAAAFWNEHLVRLLGDPTAVRNVELFLAGFAAELEGEDARLREAEQAPVE